ncbi:MAG: LysM peptidoglycan-binding domain-containing protein, partial [Bacteroidales bacterium]|nr:LysM peptidoglycan-binding domain-containing protein [Bacteroidales bacterium]
SNSPPLGERLRIPQTPAKQQEKKQEQKTETVRYKVKRKETLYSIAREYGLTVDDIYNANPGLNPKIKTGQIINIPRITVAGTYIVHKITRTTKIQKVAKLYRVPAHEILDINPSLGNKLYAGQTVKIPIGGKAILANESTGKESRTEESPKEEHGGLEAPSRCSKQKPIKGKTFKVALMVPLFLEEMDSLNTESFLSVNQDNFKPFRFLHFYEGALMAVDSLRAQEMKIELFVYDVDKSITKTVRVLQKPEIRQMDLIIGPFYQQSFDQVALFAGNFNIPVVNPLSYRSETVEKYRTVLKVKSGTKYQPDLLAALIAEYYQGARVFLVTQSAFKDQDKLAAIRHKIKTVVPPQIKISNTDIYNLAIAVAHRDEEFDDQSPLPVYSLEGRRMDPEMISESLTDSTTFDNSLTRIVFMNNGLVPFMETAGPLRTNLVIIYGENKAFVMDVMNKLNEFRDSLNIQIIGMPSWERFNNIDNVQANNMNLLYFSTDFIDYNSQNVQQFVHAFRQQFKTEPNNFGFAGFDITYYMLYALFRFDKKLYRCLPKAPMKMLRGFYRMEQTGRARNLENTYWHMLRYNNYNIQKLPDPKWPPKLSH